jgi:uncharacterized membrane protein
MNATEKFLDALRGELRKYPSGDVDDLLEYYGELIGERIANKEKEADVLAAIGTPKEVAASFRQEFAINRAVKRPSFSNTIKVLVAILGVLSLPLLIPVLALIVLCLVVAVMMIGVFFALVACGVFASVAAVVDMTLLVHSGDAPFYLLLLTLGGACIVLALAFELTRGIIWVVRWLIRRFAQWLKTRRERKNKEEQ